MKILITGGCGYIGSHAVVELVNAGHEPLIVDDLSNSKLIAHQRLEELCGRKILFFQTNVSDYLNLKKVFQCFQPEAVIHFAGYKSVPESALLPLSYYANNVGATCTLLKVMVESGCNKIVFSSTASVYGNPTVFPINEASPTVVTNTYARTKLISESMLEDLTNTNKDFTAVILRYFNPVGAHPSMMIGEDPSQPPGNLFPIICRVASGQLPLLSIYGGDYPTRDGTCVRDFIHVCDLARGHVNAVESTVEPNRIFRINLGTGCGYSVREVVERFQLVNKVSVNFEIAGRRLGDVVVSYANTNFARAILKWTPNYTLDDMCMHAWKWHLRNSI
jgi:UDP-glucose 4-epimerase